MKRSISLSNVVADWADELAARKGYATNFSAYIADLIRRDKERDDDALTFAVREQNAKPVSRNLETARNQVANTVQNFAQNPRRWKK